MSLYVSSRVAAVGVRIQTPTSCETAVVPLVTACYQLDEDLAGTSAPFPAQLELFIDPGVD